MTETRLFVDGTTPDFTTPAWYAERERAPHLEQSGHRGRLDLAAIYVLRAYVGGAMSFVDLGAGDGGLLELVREQGTQIAAHGYDLQPANVAGAAERGVDVTLADVLDPDAHLWGDVVACTEFLEHLVDPHGFVRSIPPSVAWVVASSPAFETAESHYAHHCWAWDQDGYARLFTDAGWHIVHHEVTGDFQVLLAAR